MLTAKSEDYDRLFGLTIGANDYMSKPFNPQELVLRVKSIFRLIDSSRPSSNETEETIEAGGIVLNTSTRDVTAHHLPVSLTVKEFDLLLLLVTHPNKFSAQSASQPSLGYSLRWRYDDSNSTFEETTGKNREGSFPPHTFTNGVGHWL